MQFALISKIQLNMHDLNNERAEEIRRVPIIYELGTGYKFIEEAVAVSGVMLKHYHFANFVETLKKKGSKLCPICLRGEAIRVPPQRIGVTQLSNWLGKEEGEIENYTKSVWEGTEDDVINICAGEDVHGFLRPEPVLRRESLVKFSWMLPLYLESLEEFGSSTPFVVLQHSRNIRNIPKSAPRELKQMQMPYPRAYGDGVFAFVSLADLGKVGYSFSSGKQVLDKNEKVNRQKAIMEAYAPLISGLAGASLSRALPSCKIREVVGIAVKNTCTSITAPVHPIYGDYFEKTLDLYNSYAKLFPVELEIFTYGLENPSKSYDKIKIIKVNEPLDVFSKSLEFFGLSVKAT